MVLQSYYKQITMELKKRKKITKPSSGDLFYFIQEFMTPKYEIVLLEVAL
jgi:hypothetical protein